MTPLPKSGFGPPSYGTFSTPLRCQCSLFPVQESTTEQTRSSFGGVQKFSGERVLWYVFLPPYVLHPPISRPNNRDRFVGLLAEKYSLQIRILPRIPSNFHYRYRHQLLSEPPFTGVSGPSGLKIAKTSQKGLFGGPPKSRRKYPRKSKNGPKSPIFRLFGRFFDFLGYFRGLFGGPPKRPFLRLFCDFGPGGPGDSCKWRLGSQDIRLKIAQFGNHFGYNGIFCRSNSSQGHKDRATTLGKSRGTPQSPAETPRNPCRDARRGSENPLRGKFPPRASRRVVPLGW